MQASWVAVNAFDIWILITLVFEFWAVPMWLRLGSVLSWTRLLVSLPSHLPVGVFCVSQLVQSTIISSQVRLNSVLYYIAYYCNNLSWGWGMSALTVSKCSSRRVVYNQVSVDTSCVVSILLVYSIVTAHCCSALVWVVAGAESSLLGWPGLHCPGGGEYRPVISGLWDNTRISVEVISSDCWSFLSCQEIESPSQANLVITFNLLTFSDHFSTVLALTPVTGVPRAISTYLYSASVLLVLLTTPMYPSIWSTREFKALLSVVSPAYRGFIKYSVHHGECLRNRYH